MNNNNKPAAVILIVLLAAGITSASSWKEATRGPLVLKTLDYVLDLRVDYDHEKLFGDCRLTVLNSSSQPVGRIPLILYRLLKVKSVADSVGSALPFSQGVTEYEDWDRIQFNFIEVSLPSSILPGAKGTIALHYEGYLGGYQEAGVRYVRDKVDKDFTIIRMDGLAYPIVGVPSEAVNRAAGLQSYDYRINVTVPDSYQAANGGRLLGKVSRNGQTTFSFRNNKPAWRMDVAIAQYRVLEDAPNCLTVYHFPQDAAGGASVLKAMKDSMMLYSGWFGVLTGGQGLTTIEVPEGYGSQADVTAILLTRDVFNDRTRLTDLYHEISHLWFVKPLDPAPSRLESEGLAVFLQYLVQEKLEAKADALERGANRVRSRFLEQCKAKPEYTDIAIADYGKKDVTDLSYTKGMLFFYFLYRMAGEKALLDAVAAYYQKYHETGATLSDFLNIMKKSLDKDLSAFYRDWIYGADSSKLLVAGVPFDDIVKKYR